MKYMLDTNICIYLIRQNSTRVMQRLAQHPLMEIALSSITVAELEFGVQKSSNPAQNRRALAQFLLPLTIAPFDHDAAAAYGGVRAHLEGQGMPIGSLDTLIAAHALSLNLVLVTHNSAEFSRVPGLLVEDWTQ